MNTFALLIPGLISGVLADLVSLVDKAPAAEDVKAGWGAFAIFLLLGAAVAFLGWSLTRHLRKAQANAEAGVFGDDNSV